MAKDSEQSTSGMVAERGIKTASDLAQFMGAMLGDLTEGRITPSVAHAACETAGVILSVAKLQLEYGEVNKDGSRSLSLVGENSVTTAKKLPA